LLAFFIFGPSSAYFSTGNNLLFYIKNKTKTNRTYPLKSFPFVRISQINPISKFLYFCSFFPLVQNSFFFFDTPIPYLEPLSSTHI